MLSDEEKQTIEYLKARLYGNESCKFIDVAQSDLRIFINLIEKQQKIIKEQSYTNKKLRRTLKTVRKERNKQQKEIERLEARKYMYNAKTGEISQIPLNNNYISKDKIKAKIEEIERRIDFLDKELTEAYIMREKLGTETEIDTNEQYIYNMEQERSIRHTQKRILQSLLEKE